MGWHGSKNGKKGHGSTGHGGHSGGRGSGLASLLGSFGHERRNSRYDDADDHEDDRRDRTYRDKRRDDEGPSGQFTWGRPGYDEERAGRNAVPGLAGRFSNNSTPSQVVQSKFVFLGAIGAVLLWSLFAWVAYGLIDGLGGWLSANTGALLQGGKDAIGTIGIGKNVVDQVNVQGASGLLEQLVASAVAVARPLIVFVWFLGCLAILALPFVLQRLSSFARSRRH